MNIVIKNSQPNGLSPEIMKVTAWLTDRFGERVSAVHPSTFNTKQLDIVFWTNHFRFLGLSIPAGYNLVYIGTHASENNFTIYDILYGRTNKNGTASIYKGDILIWFADDSIAVECKLTVS
jgi:hypothetical protein